MRLFNGYIDRRPLVERDRSGVSLVGSPVPATVGRDFQAHRGGRPVQPGRDRAKRLAPVHRETDLFAFGNAQPPLRPVPTPTAGSKGPRNNLGESMALWSAQRTRRW
jgi:hypothetical protein